jgi:hypothetical protein
MLEYDWLAGDRPARPGPLGAVGRPAGTRVTLTQTGPGELQGLVATAMTAWQAHLEGLAGQLREADG